MSSHGIPTASGIYKIICTANKKIYIGSSINLRDRRNAHFSELRRNKHGNRHLQNAWNKYGEQAFTFEVVEFVLPMSLTSREQHWLNLLSPFGKKGFNLAPEAGSSLGVKRLPCAPETIEKIRQGNLGKNVSPETREKLRGNTYALGHKRSLETREKMRQAKLGNKYSLGNKHNLGRKQTPKHIEHNRRANFGREFTTEHRAKLRQAAALRQERKRAQQDDRANER